MVHTAELLFPSQSLRCWSLHHQIAWANIAIGTTYPGVEKSIKCKLCSNSVPSLLNLTNIFTKTDNFWEWKWIAAQRTDVPTKPTHDPKSFQFNSRSLVVVELQLGFVWHSCNISKNTFNNHDKYIEQLWQIHANFSLAWLADLGTECMIVSDMAKHWSDLAGSDEKEKKAFQINIFLFNNINNIYWCLQYVCVFWRKGDTICVPFDPKHQNELFS